MKFNYPLSLISLAVVGYSNICFADIDLNSSCAKYDIYNTRSNADFIPLSNCDTINPGLFGLRDELANQGIGVQFSYSQSLSYDVLQNNSGTQTYGGQDATNVSVVMGTMTYDLSRIGFNDNSQLTLQLDYQDSDYTAVAPRIKNVDALAINQQFSNKQIEVQYGFFPIFRSFYGLSLGANTTSSAQGASSFVPVQVGMSSDEPTPAFMVAFKDPSLRYYDRFAVTRSNSQSDTTENHTGLKWDVGDARALYTNEVGYRRMASKDEKSLWIRSGIIYNTTESTYLNDISKSSANYAGYLAVTAQLTQPYDDMRGIGLDIKANLANSDVNTIDRDYGISVFYMGPFNSRPMDMVALGYQKSFYSDSAKEAVLPHGVSDTSSTTLSYAAHVTNGLFMITGMSYTTDPSLSTKASDALNFSETVNFTF